MSSDALVSKVTLGGDLAGSVWCNYFSKNKYTTPQIAERRRAKNLAGIFMPGTLGANAERSRNFMQQKGFITSFIAIIVVLAIAFLSQQPYAKLMTEKDDTLVVQNTTSGYIAQFSDWFKASVYPRVNGEVTTRGAAVQEEITKQKDIAAQTLWEKIKEYFAEKFSGISGTKVE